MKSKEEIKLEIMKRVISYEKKRLYLWYEVVVFVLLVVLLSEVFLLFDLVFEMQEQYFFNFVWVFSEDWETIKYLSGNIFAILMDELPWAKILISFTVLVALFIWVVYAIGRLKIKKLKGKQIHKFEDQQKS